MNKNLLLFIKNPGTSGKDVIDFLSNNFKLQYLNVGDQSKLEEGTSAIGMWGDHFVSQFKAKKDKESIQSGQRFAVVRNPYTRVVSTYKYLKQRWPNGFYGNHDLETCLQHRFFFEEGDPFHVYHDWLHFTVTQTSILYGDKMDFDQSCSPKVDDSQYPKKPKKIILIKFENLKKEFGKLMEQYEISSDEIDLFQPEEEDLESALSELTEASIERIENVFHEDFENFGYEKITKN